MTTYVIVDIECDGRVPGLHSMISLAAAACNEDGVIISEFNQNLLPLPGATEFQDTMNWWKTQPADVWRDVTNDQKTPEQVTKNFAAWWQALPGRPLFISHSGLDWSFVNWYVHKYIGESILGTSGFDLKTYAAAQLHWQFSECKFSNYKSEWLGNVPHSHRAIDDARGYAHFFFYLRSLS